MNTLQIRNAGGANALAGFTLLEVLITMFVIAVALLGTAGLQAYAMKISQTGQLRTEAVILGLDLLERIEANNPGAVGGNAAMSQRSIGIEMSNIGFLRKAPNGDLHTIYSASDIYCSARQTAYYQKLPTPYRGERYYAKFTQAQYRSLVLLLRFLTAGYNIPRTLLAPQVRVDAFASAAAAEDFKGICSHVNFRSSGKWDISPAFEWGKIEKGLLLGK